MDGTLEQRHMAAVGASLASGIYRGALLRELSVAAIAGALAGTLVGGIGSRVAMRISGAMSDPSMVGIAITGNGNVLGEVTLFGTLALMFFGGFSPGILGGVIYAAARPWLRPLGRWAGLAFGLALLAAVGPSVLEPFNIDFRKFGSPILNVMLFALLFPLFGVAHALLSETVDRRMTRTPAWELAGYGALVAAALVLGLFAVSTIGSLVEGDRRDLRPFVPLYWLATALVLRAVLAPGRALTDARTLGVRSRVLSYTALAVPSLLGLPATVDAITFLTRP